MAAPCFPGWSSNQAVRRILVQESQKDISLQISFVWDVPDNPPRSVFEETRKYWIIERAFQTNLYSAFKERSLEMPASIKKSMIVSTSFPVKGISINKRYLTIFKVDIVRSVGASLAAKTTYSKETEEYFDKSKGMTYASNMCPNKKDMVVYKEELYFGTKPVWVHYKCRTRECYKSLKIQDV